MTMTDPCTIDCICCGARNECRVIRWRPQFFHPDLDMRPGEDYRSTIDCWIQRCVTCGYCARSIGAEPPPSRDVVESDVYVAQLGCGDYPELANSFLCSAMILEKRGDAAKASTDALAAAWVCDDAGLVAASRACRWRAASLLEVAIADPHAEFGSVSDAMSREGDAKLGRPEETLRLVDVLRRIGEFSRAESIAKAWVIASESRDEAWWSAYLQEFPGPELDALAPREWEYDIRRLMQHELDLIRQEDTGAHRSDEPFILNSDERVRSDLIRRLEGSDPDRLHEALRGDDIEACRRRVALSEQLDRAEREAAIARDLAERAERTSLREAAAQRVMAIPAASDARLSVVRMFWPDAQSLATSGAVNDSVLLAESLDQILDGLVATAAARCPRCGFTKGREPGVWPPACTHCGWSASA